MSKIVEHVARAIAAEEGYDVDGLAAYAKAHSIAKADYERLKRKSCAAIRATLQFARDNPTEAMLASLHRDVQILCTPAQREAEIINDKEVLASVIGALLSEIEQDGGEK